MPQANGEFVKIYLYLLRCLTSENKDLDLAHIADIFSCTESDILRTLRYWESRRLLVLSGTGENTSIDFLEPALSEPEAAAKTAPSKKDAKTKKVPDKEVLVEASTPAPTALTAQRMRELKQMDDVRQMLFIAEQYMGTTLSRSVTDELLYIYDTLHFSVDLIDYLIEYCVSKGSSSIHYIKKVALSWHANGIDSVSKAKQESTTFHRDYFTILKALGITNRNPLPGEVNTFQHWLHDYGFSLDIITEACTRTIAQIGKANHKYTTRILDDWHGKGVRHLTDIQALDTLHRQLQADRAEQNNKKMAAGTQTRNAKSNFNDFKQRSYDYTSLEDQLLNQS